jgi:hypothetical protein
LGLGADEQRRTGPDSSQRIPVDCAEVQSTVLRHFALDGVGRATHRQQRAVTILRYIIWRNNASGRLPAASTGQSEARCCTRTVAYHKAIKIGFPLLL